MKIKLKKKQVFLSAVNLLSLVGFAAFSLSGLSAAKSQSYNYAAERWMNGDKDMTYAQVSCFMSDSAGFTTDSLASVRASVISSLKDVSIAPQDGQKLCPDAYSASLGQAEVRSDINGKSESQITAVGGDFFLIHDFKLLDGAFFTDSDIMQDGAVIDKNLAWALYGSSDVSGMKMTINGIQYYIAGVIETPETDEEVKCAGELPLAYISYDGASGFSSGAYSEDSSGKFTTVNCYELLMPNPVENYSYKAVKTIMEGYGENVSVVQNTDRYSAYKCLKALKKISSIVVRDNQIAYPYWENASRMVQFRLSYVYLCSALCLIIPLITAIWLIIRAVKTLKRNRKKIFRAVSSKFKRIRANLKGKRNEGQKD